jgi:hypothetical protein
LGLIYSNGKGETFLIIYVYCLDLVDGKYICLRYVRYIALQETNISIYLL